MTIDALKTSLSDRYRIERELGAGGMATVYLAEDLKHGRKVAIKVLRPELAAVIGAERFVREIRTIAALQHSHILGLIDSGEVQGTAYYVMPFIEGESLRDRLNREKQLAIGDAVRLASEIASALDYAHRHGVIHRDIKPENILLHDGQALVADFGIALAVSTAGGSRMTETGLSLGTPHYMSPEQAMGERTVTARTDIYALGCVTYEMLTGDPPFTGSTAQAIVAKMMTEKPTPPSRVRDTVPAEVEDAVLTALAKLPADRFASAAEFAAVLAGKAGGREAGTRTRPIAAVPPSRRSARMGWGVAAVLAGVAAWGWWLRRSAESPQVVRFEVQPTHGTQFAFPIAGVGTEVALSPDGRQAVYAAGATGSSWKLYLTTIDQLGARMLPGTEGAFFPEFSPDGRWIAFWAADGWLKKIGVDGNGLTTLCRLENSGPNAAGLTWISDHEIVFSAGIYSKESGLLRVSSDGGTPLKFAQLDSASGERLQLSPRAADRGRLVFYSSTIASNADLAIAVIETASGKTRVFPDLRGARPLGLIDDYLIYVRGDGALMAAPFDSRKLRAGAPLQIADSITVPSSSWGVPAALSPNGSLLYQKGGTASQLVTVDQHGGARALVDSVQVYLHPRLSPDGRRLAVEVQGASGADIWIIDLVSHTTERLTNEGYNNRPEWAPDGSRVLFTSSRAPANALWSQPADGSAGGTLLFKSSEPIREGVFTPDGKAIVYRQDRAETARDIYLVPLGADQKPVPLLTSPSDEKQPRVSPDSRWLAYVSNESGREEVYVRALSAAGGRVPVSTDGGGEPLWSRDGKRLFYRVGSRVIAATIVTTPSLAVTGRDTLFDGPYATDLYHPDYDVMPDGKSFLMVRPVDDNRQLVMVVNWIEELRQRTARGR